MILIMTLKGVAEFKWPTSNYYQPEGQTNNFKIEIKIQFWKPEGIESCTL